MVTPFATTDRIAFKAPAQHFGKRILRRGVVVRTPMLAPVLADGQIARMAHARFCVIIRLLAPKAGGFLELTSGCHDFPTPAADLGDALTECKHRCKKLALQS
jgi:hypothetical protein